MKLNSEFRVEQPAAPIAGIYATSSGAFGAYSYSWSKISKFVGSVGRYCSIAGGVTFGDSEHPTDWLSTSAVLWDHNLVIGALLSGKIRN